MLVQHRLELRFQPSHVQEPVTWQMARQFEHLMFNVVSLNVGVQDAEMRISLIGEPEVVKQAKAYLKDLEVTVKTLSSQRFRGKLPKVPVRPAKARGERRAVERKLWLTILDPHRSEPFLWTIARKYDVTYKIMQCASGGKVAIISILVWGPAREVENVVGYLRGQGINVEYGEVSVGAPFTD